MELLPLSLSSQLHNQGIKPWSQFITRNTQGQDTWVISALNDEMDESLTQHLLQNLPMKINLRQKGFQVEAGNAISIEKSTYGAISDKHFKSDVAPRNYILRFCTPTTFKTAGQHVIFPSTDLLMNSLMQRWDAYADSLSLADQEVRQYLGTHVHIRDYKLSTASFSVDSAWVKGFVGVIDMRVSGPETLARVASLLLDFGRFSGVGIKTALGMGGIRFE